MFVSLGFNPHDCAFRSPTHLTRTRVLSCCTLAALLLHSCCTLFAAKNGTDESSEATGAAPPGMITSSPIPMQGRAGNGASTPMIASAPASPARSSKRKKRDSGDTAAHDDGNIVTKKMNVGGSSVAVAVATSSPPAGDSEAIAAIELTSPSSKGGTGAHKSFLETLFSPVYSLLTPFVGGRGKDVKLAAAVAATPAAATPSATPSSSTTAMGSTLATTPAGFTTGKHEEDPVDETEQEVRDLFWRLLSS